MRFAVPVVALLFASGCPHGEARPGGPSPTTAQVIERLTKAKDELRSFTGSAVMEYWLGSDRFKGEVLAMGEVGAKVRIAALSPAGESTIAEMACDGSQFVSINYQNNCVLTGPCTKESIATFFGIELTPDEFLHLALGTPPLVADGAGTVAWDAKQGVYRASLASAAGKQSIGLAIRDQQWDVVDTTLVAGDGAPVWSVKHADFGLVKDPEGKAHRIPGKSHFTTPNKQRADLTVEWHERKVNIPIEAKKFTIAVPAGLPVCGAPPAKK